MIFLKLFDSIEGEIGWLDSRSRTEFTFRLLSKELAEELKNLKILCSNSIPYQILSPKRQKIDKNHFPKWFFTMMISIILWELGAKKVPFFWICGFSLSESAIEKCLLLSIGGESLKFVKDFHTMWRRGLRIGKTYTVASNILHTF